MNQRINFNEVAAEEMRMKAAGKSNLLLELDSIREKLRMVDVRSNNYVSLKKQQAEIIAKLATL